MILAQRNGMTTVGNNLKLEEPYSLHVKEKQQFTPTMLNFGEQWKNTINAKMLCLGGH